MTETTANMSSHVTGLRLPQKLQSLFSQDVRKDKVPGAAHTREILGFCSSTLTK